MRYCIELLCFIHFLEILPCNGAQVKSGCRTLNFKISAANKRLANHNVRTIRPITDIGSCRRQCFMEPLCSSINFCVKPGEDSWCELVDTDQTRHASDMQNKTGCTHLSAESACVNNPCVANATCSGDYLKDQVPYKCICPRGYEGLYCNKDIDECATNNQSCQSSNLTCVNLPGTNKCVCQQGTPMTWKVLFDFESGTLDGWVLTGTVFNNQPTYGDNPRARNRGQTANQKGNWWVGGYENRSSPSHTAGRTQGDVPTGKMTGPSFTIYGNKLRFLIGGGCDKSKIYAELLIDGQSVRKDTGLCSETMKQREWDVVQYFGKEAKLRLVDISSGGWGHLNFDHFEGFFC